ncbi:MAG: glycerophosphodiester phosphodiesterase, partial [Candidatus Brocadiaceae bacterium]
LKGEGTEPQAVATVQEMEMQEQVVFVSFVPDRLRTVRRSDPSLAVAPIFAHPPKDAARRAAEIDASGVRILYRDLTWGLVEQAHELGLEVGAWSPNEEAEWRAMTALGVDVICTDFPDRLTAMLGRDV